MGAISSLSRGVQLVLRNPSILGVLFAYSLVSGVVSFVQTVSIPGLSILGLLVSVCLSVFVFPFIVGGIVGMANRSIIGEAGDATIGAFIEYGKRSYVELVAMAIVLSVVTVVWAVLLTALTIGLFVFVLVGGTATAGMSGGAGSSAIPTGVGPVIFVVFLVGLGLGIMLPVFVVQYYAGAVVIDDTGIVGGIRHALGLLRHNVISTFGFDAILIGVGIGSVVVSSGALFLIVGGPLTPETLSNLQAEAGVVGTAIHQGVTVILGTCVGAFQWCYYAAIYRDIAGYDDPASESEWRRVTNESAGTDL